MRQRVKAACRTAQTVKDVAHLLQGNYFNAYFFNEDWQRARGYFNPEDYSIHELVGSEENGWGEGQDPRAVTLNPQVKVRHISSSENVHRFILFYPPG